MTRLRPLAPLLVVVVAGLLATPPVASAAPGSSVHPDADGDALLVRTVRPPARDCPGSASPRGIEIRTRRQGGRASRPVRLGSRCRAELPQVAVAPGGTALVSWREGGQVFLAQGSTSRGVRLLQAISARRPNTTPRPIALNARGDAVVPYVQAGDVFAAVLSTRGRGRIGRAQRLGRGKGSVAPAVAPDGAALVAWTTTGAGGEVGTSAPNQLRAVRRGGPASRFGAPETVASGTLRDLVAAAGPGGTALGYTAEDVPDGGTSAVTYAPTGAPFEPPFAFPAPYAVSIDAAGVARALNAQGSIRRVAPGAWTTE